MKKTSRIYVSGHEEFIGAAIVRLLKKNGYTNLILRSKKNLELKNQAAVNSFFGRNKPEYVFLASQKSGGILSNINHPADYIYENLLIETNVINAAAKNGAKKLIFLGASCMYPKKAKQPIKEDSLYLGPTEETSRPYATAKISGVEMCRAYEKQYGIKCMVVVPATVYGPGANFNLESSHVLTALIGNFFEAVKKHKKEIFVWGSGKPLREFIYVDDLASACVFLAKKPGVSGMYNVGSGEEISIKKLAEMIRREAKYEGKIIFDRSKPDGVMRKILSSKRISDVGWRAKVMLAEGIKSVYNSRKSNG